MITQHKIVNIYEIEMITKLINLSIQREYKNEYYFKIIIEGI